MILEYKYLIGLESFYINIYGERTDIEFNDDRIFLIEGFSSGFSKAKSIYRKDILYLLITNHSEILVMCVNYQFDLITNIKSDFHNEMKAYYLHNKRKSIIESL